MLPDKNQLTDTKTFIKENKKQIKNIFYKYS